MRRHDDDTTTRLTLTMPASLGIVLAALAFIVGMTIGKHDATTLQTLTTAQATIGATAVPMLDCVEDEVIAYTGIDTLGCVHVDTFVAATVCASPKRWYVEPTACKE
jgi:multisubunit Na+/H+ antiporter MnhB subunit